MWKSKNLSGMHGGPQQAQASLTSMVISMLRNDTLETALPWLGAGAGAVLLLVGTPLLTPLLLLPYMVP